MEAKVGHVRKNKVPPESVEEKALLEVASQYSNVSPHNILVIGGTLTLPEISGYKRFRRRSKNVDFVVNRKGLEDFLSYQSGNNEEDSTRWWPEGEAYTTRNKGILCTFFPDGIEGYVIPEEEFSRAIPRETSVGSVYTISDELNLALKVRRGIQGKDAQDAASTIVGAVLSGRDFDAEAFADYLVNGTCEEAGLSRLLGYMSELADGGSKSVGNRHLDLFITKLNESTAFIEGEKKLQNRDENYVESVQVNDYSLLNRQPHDVGEGRNATDTDSV